MAGVGQVLGLGALGIGGLATAAAALQGTDYLKQRFIALNKPSWEIQGQGRMYGDQGGTVRYVKGQEALVKGMYEIPYDIVKNRVTSAVGSVLDAPGDMYKSYKLESAFDKIRNDPSVRAMGVSKARDMFREVGGIAPDIVRKAPNSVVPAIQNAIMTDSSGLRPDFVQNLTKAQSSLSSLNRQRYT